jgi:glyceraldehyde 3-phosphate dehydrogenase
MKRVKVGINGLGRIGRAFLKLAIARPELEVVAVNDLGDIANLAYLLKYDTAYGRSGLTVEVTDGHLVVNGQRITVCQEKDPAKLPWGQLGVEVVVESTGFFDSFAGSRAHLTAGAHKVVITAPVKDEPPPGVGAGTILLGINEDKFSTCQITSNASCTTNSASPLIQIMMETIGVKKAVLNTVHAYTATQKIVDGPDAKDFRRGRAAAQNLAPSTTGAAIAVTQAIPALAGKFDGIAVRVPVISGSMVDVTFLAGRSTSVAEVNKILKEAAAQPRWQKTFAVTEEPLVSTDILGLPYGSIADLSLTKVIDGDLVKVMAWYDNEMGYTHTLLEHVLKAGNA